MLLNSLKFCRCCMHNVVMSHFLEQLHVFQRVLIALHGGFSCLHSLCATAMPLFVDPCRKRFHIQQAVQLCRLEVPCQSGSTMSTSKVVVHVIHLGGEVGVGIVPVQHAL